MTLLASLQSLMQTYGSSQVILVAWLALLALAMLVFLVLIAFNGRHPGRELSRRGTDQRASFWQQGMTPPHGPCHHLEGHPYERR